MSGESARRRRAWEGGRELIVLMSTDVYKLGTIQNSVKILL